MKSVNLHSALNCPSFEEVLSGLTSSGQYDHMRLILSKNNNRAMGQKYLMITPSAFGAVKLLDVDYGGNRICMVLQDICTGMIRSIQLDVYDPAFRFVLISWQDIQEILKGEDINKPIEDELLEFEF